MGKTRILIVEDEHDIAEMIEYNLTERGYDAIKAFNGPDGMELAKKERPDLIILDLMLPIVDGFEVCKNLKKEDSTSNIPIIILSAKSQETDKVLGLELGADDYLTKPFSPRELIARIKAILRRKALHDNGPILDRGEVLIDVARHMVTVGKKEIKLTHTEFRLLELVARRPGMVFSRTRILDGIFGDDSIACDRTVDAHIKTLRRKLGVAKCYIETIRGVGYRFRDTK